MKEIPKINGRLAARIQWLLGVTPWLSATTIANLLEAKASSVSSLLVKLVDQKVLVRAEGKGPSGGWGYRLRVKPTPKSLWTDTLLDKRCRAIRFDTKSSCYRMQYENGMRLWAAPEQFGTGKRFQWSRTDFILDELEASDPV